jgi:hypothetical protein
MDIFEGRSITFFLGRSEHGIALSAFGYKLNNTAKNVTFDILTIFIQTMMTRITGVI